MLDEIREEVDTKILHPLGLDTMHRVFAVNTESGRDLLLAQELWANGPRMQDLLGDAQCLKCHP